MQTLWQDMRYALRQLRRAPGFTLTAVLTLALGLGITATVASVAWQVLLAPLPFPEPQRLVGVAFTWPTGPASASQTGPAYDFLARTSHSFAASTLIDDTSAVANLSDSGGHASSIAVAGVSLGYFDTLGVRPARGRGFTAEEDRPGGPHALVLSHGLWMSSFGGDPGIVGRTLRLNQESVTVVGIMPADFRAETYLTRTSMGSPGAWRPLQLSNKDPGYGGDNYQMYARLRPGVSIPQAAAELHALEGGLYRENPDYGNWRNPGGQTPHLRIAPLGAVLAGDVHESLTVMLWATGAVLLLTNVNLAGLNTARALRRSSELALRTALGASRGRLVRLAALEAAMLTLAGVAGAVLLVRGLLPLLLKTSPVAIPHTSAHANVAATVTIAAALGLASALIFGAPLALAALLGNRRNLRAAGAHMSQTKTQVRAGQSLIVLQISLAIVLVATASLLLGTFLKLRARPVGFEPDRLIVFQTNLKGDRYASAGETARFVDKVLANLQHAPGVSSVAAINGLPLDRGLNDSIPAQGSSTRMLTIEFRPVTPGYLKTISLPLLQGRDLSDADRSNGLPVALASTTAARQLWPGKQAIGSTFPLSGKQWRIVGIVADAPDRTLSQDPAATVYVPLAQMPDRLMKALNGWFPMSFVVRLPAHLDAAAITRAAVAAADPEIPVAKLATMREVIEDSMAAPRFFTQLAGGFGAFSLLLTAIGLFGLLNYQVTQRTHEIGVRMALGASRERILRAVLTGSASLLLLGSIVGIVAALFLRPLVTHWIVGSVLNADSATPDMLFNRAAAVLLAAVLLALTTLCAAALPARRAAQVEPIEALRTE